MPNPYNRRFRRRPYLIKKRRVVKRRFRRNKRITRRQRLFKDIIHTVFHINQEIASTSAVIAPVSATINFSQFTGLISFVDNFQKFRVNKIVQKFIPEQNVNIAISTGTSRVAEWHTYRVYEPQSAPSSLPPFLAESTYRTGQFIKPKSVAGVPFIDLLANPDTGTTPVVAMPKRKPWLNSTSINSIQMYKGYQFAIEPMSSINQNWTVETSLYISCKHRLSQ